MQNSFRIFILVTVLLAKFTLSFFGQEFGLHNTTSESIGSPKQNVVHVDAFVFEDENESRIENDDDSSENDFFLTSSYSDFHPQILQQKCIAAFRGQTALPDGKLFLLNRNFRI